MEYYFKKIVALEQERREISPKKIQRFQLKFVNTPTQHVGTVLGLIFRTKTISCYVGYHHNSKFFGDVY